MGDITSGCTIKEMSPNVGLKSIVIETAATADNADTIALTLADYGIRSYIGVLTWIHSTSNSIITVETTDACTSAVSGGVLTLTIGGSTANKKRTIMVLGF